MKNTYISMIRFGAVAVLALGMFTSEALAAPVLLPATATSISDTTATLMGKVANPGYKNTTVWFEWGDTPNPTMVTGMRDVFSDGFFLGYLHDLKPGATYYFRTAATEGGVTTYSPVVSFTTRGGEVVAQPVTQVTSAPVSQNNTATSSATKTNKPVTKTVVAQKISDTKNNNTAAVGNAGGVLPGTLIGWVSLLIGLLIVFLIIAMILDSIEERRKAREEAKRKRLEREKETE